MGLYYKEMINHIRKFIVEELNPFEYHEVEGHGNYKQDEMCFVVYLNEDAYDYDCPFHIYYKCNKFSFQFVEYGHIYTSNILDLNCSIVMFSILFKTFSIF